MVDTLLDFIAAATLKGNGVPLSGHLQGQKKFFGKLHFHFISFCLRYFFSKAHNA
jgi:hypothetical protein